MKSFFYFPDNYIAYNLKEIARKDGNPLEIKGKYNGTDGVYKVSVLNHVVVPEKCENKIKGTPAIMFVHGENQENCVKLLSADPKDNKYKLTNEKDAEKGFIMLPDESKEGQKDFIKVQFVCANGDDAKEDEPDYDL